MPNTSTQPTSSPDILFQLSAVSVQFGRVHALADCTLNIGRGERLALVGANGSGKSTLLRTLHGLLRPTQGRVQPHPTLRQAMLFQRPHLLRLSALNNVALGIWLDRARRLSWAQSRTRAMAALQRVGLSAVAQQGGRQLSGGQQQRLALVRAWGRQPEVEALMAAFADQAETPSTLLWASHNLGQVKRLASRVIYLEAGRILADLPVADFFDAHLLALCSPAAHAFVQGELS